MLPIWRPWFHPSSHYSLLFIKPSVSHSGQHPHWGGNISEEHVCSLCTSNHNTMRNTLAPSPRARRNLLPVIISFIHLTLFLVLLFSLSFSLSLSVSLALFSLFVCEEMLLHLFCVIEEGDAGESVQPWVREGIQPQLVCCSPIMSKRDKMKVCSVCHVLQPWKGTLRKGQIKDIHVLCNCWWTWIDFFCSSFLSLSWNHT